MKIAMPGRILERQVGGNTTYARNLAQGLERLGVEITPIKYSNFAPANVLWESLAGLNRRSWDAVHYVADTGPAVRTRVPSLVTVHGVASRWVSVARNRRQELTWRARVGAAIRSVDSVLTVSESSADDIAEIFNYPRERLTVIHHGIGRFYFDAAPCDPPEALAALAGRPYVLYVGNIEPRKNIESLVAAMSAPSVRSLGLHLVIAGKPAWNFDGVMQAINSSPHVTYLGFVSEQEKKALMQGAELFCFPSHYEGFGFPVLEALATGTVVCCTASGSLKEVAGPAINIPHHDAESIAEAIVRGATDEGVRRRCAEEGPEWARKFTWEESVRKHMDAYGKVLG